MHGEIAQLVEQGTENPRVPSPILGLATIRCGSSSGVEHNLAKVGVAGSNPVFRSMKNESPAVCAAGLFRVFRRERPFVS